MLNIIIDNIGLISALISILAGLIAAYKYTENYQKNAITRQNLIKLKELFESTVAKLSSDNLSEKLSAAILLRRFFRNDTEGGVGGIPLSDETINTIAAILRAEKTSDFQKLLADSLKYAPSLKKSDFQKANLSNAVFGKADLDLSGADFYRADLSNASFKVQGFREKDENGIINNDGVNLCKAQFYQTNLQKTNFSGANLEGAIFFQANLDGANFLGAKNIPENIKKYLNESYKYSPICNEHINNKIFISKPRVMNETQKSSYKYVISELEKDFELEILEKIDDQISSIIPKIKDKIFNSSGMVIFAFKQYEITSGKFRWWNEVEKREISNEFFTTPWIYIETGIASAFKKPMLVISDFKINDGVFANEIDDDLIFLTNPDGDFKEEEFILKFKEWKRSIFQ